MPLDTAPRCTLVFTYALQQISKAAVVYDARAILKQVTCTKQRAIDAAAGAAGETRA